MQVVSDPVIQLVFRNCFSPPPICTSAFILFSYVVLATSENMSLDERVDMPSCNLAETVHNKWLQQLGNQMTCLYKATVDDLIRAFMQTTNYRMYLKGSRSEKGPDKVELRLQVAQKSGDVEMNVKVLSSFPGAEDLITKPRGLVGTEIFGSSKRKLDLSLGSHSDSHRQDKVNFSIPRMSTRSTKARIEEALSDPVHAVQHTTCVLETDCDTSK